MLTLPPSRPVGPKPAGEGGFTLIEVLVAMVTGLVVSLALFTILEISTRQEQSITNRVQANQTARTTMTHMVDELHSACLAPNFRPVQAGSGTTKLIFVNAYTKEAVIPNATTSAEQGAHQHAIEYISAKNQLVDKTYASTAGTVPSFTFSATPVTTSIFGERISALKEKVGAEEKELPVFKYFEYATASGGFSSTSAGVNTLSEIKVTAGTPMTAETAAKVAAVEIQFAAAPQGLEVKKGAEGLTLNSQVTFAFTSPNAETPVADTPCE
jgi:Tfp pilus assembly protein PilV